MANTDVVEELTADCEGNREVEDRLRDLQQYFSAIRPSTLRELVNRLESRIELIEGDIAMEEGMRKVRES